MDLVSALQEAQKARGLNDSQFSKLLGIHYSSWSRVQSRERKVNMAILKHVMQNLPELVLPAIDWLREEK